MENKNYYEWLEISKHASPEVIEKAYKALVKKYHPDLQEGNNKIEAEEIIKHINEAYDILSDETKRTEYDATLVDDSVSRQDYESLQDELNNLRTQQNQNKTNYQQPPQNQTESNYTSVPSYEEPDHNYQQEIDYQNKINDAVNQAYYDAYIQDLKNRGYKIKYKKTFKDRIKSFIALILTIIIILLIFQIPPVKNYCISLYEKNPLIKIVVDIIVNLFNAISGKR